MATYAGRSTCIWCARVLAYPDVPCSHRGAEAFAAADDETCHTVLSAKLRPAPIAPLPEFGAQLTE